MRNLGIPELQLDVAHAGGGGGVGHRAARRRRGRRRARRTPCSCTARSTSARGGGSVSPTAAVTRRRERVNWYLPYGLDTPAKMYALVVPALHAALRRHQRRLRPLHGRGPQARGDQPERVVLRAADHARGPPGVALDRRADAAAPRLLPGERRRRRDGRDERRAGRDLPQPAVRIAAAVQRARRAATSCSTTTTPISPTSPRPRRCATQLCDARGLRPTTSTSR